MIWSLQVLRFVAALMIVYLHAARVGAEVALNTTGDTRWAPYDMASAANAGVDIFFVLSGAVITLTAPKLTARQFFWRRFRRVMPIYLICSIPPVMVAFATADFGWRKLLATVLLWPATDVLTAPVLFVGWTLCFEMLFYTGATLVLVDRRWIYALVALFAGACLLRPFGPVFQFLGNPIIVEFAFGAAIILLPRSRFGVMALPVGVAALLLSGQWFDPGVSVIDALAGVDAEQRVIAFGIPAALIVYGARHIDAKPGLWTYLGEASYVLYLVHPSVAKGLLTFWMIYPIPPYLVALCTMGAALLLSWRVHELIDKPVLRILPRRL